MESTSLASMPKHEGTRHVVPRSCLHCFHFHATWQYRRETSVGTLQMSREPKLTRQYLVRSNQDHFALSIMCGRYHKQAEAVRSKDFGCPQLRPKRERLNGAWESHYSMKQAYT